MMIDAGSGGTRLHAFRWPPRVADKLRPLHAAVTVPEEIFSVKVKPGISAFVGNTTALEVQLRQLLEMAKEGLGHLKKQWYTIPIYLKATAGARDLFQDERDDIFLTIRGVLASGPFFFKNSYWARTISGEEESVYAWITVNAAFGTIFSSENEQTWGTLDMGGASTQIAFVPHDLSIIQNYFALHLSYQHHHLYAHSYLQFGYRDANQRIVKLRRSQEGPHAGTRENPIRHPCFSRGDLFLQPMQGPFVSDTESLDKGETHEMLWVLGSGNFDECLDLAIKTLELNATCYVPSFSRKFAVDSSTGACAINGVYQPNVYTQKFVAMGQFAKIGRLLGLPGNKPVPLGKMLERTREICGSSFAAEEFVEDFDDPEGLNVALPSHPGAIKRMSQQDPMGTPRSRCWKAVWLWSVLHKGFRFPLESVQIQFATHVAGRSTGWALGALLHEVNMYPWSPAGMNEQRGVATVLALGLAACCGGAVGSLAGVALVLRRLRPPDPSRSEYRALPA